ncbi:probable 2-oxoglutarate-dependent dioxygenase AOP1 [Coffea eugenioides]|uniref:probable 2-oxoglutarate-dependent dioxygenase AOP1 n=1 Tax=Coffea eugenioides TaxID=49369 RepID=UPI000F60EDD9|nr:probable 2-oxoglutarate-dependent dioxygenase AOP1 [Coffea eugenioides]XP_027164561.1 probable 2-oxoglutarate-dependent dioxygenase AOP1 [Coffea eugenioides]
MGSPAPRKLLVVDFTNEELKPGSSSWASACNDIQRALENHGCFIALYNKVSPELDKAIFQAADDLFDLPTELKVQNINEKPYHGYIGQIPFVPLHEGLGIDYATTLDGVQSFTNLMWPKGNKSFSESSFSFAKTVAKLDEMVIKMLFESYGVEKYSDSHIDSTRYLLRFLKYRAPEVNETTMAFPSHTDKSFLTILYQNHISGLEIRTRDDEWIKVDFPQKSFVVMAGDACQAWSNDRVLSSNHKVTMDANGKETRYTIALFSFLSKMVQVPEELVNDEKPLQFKPFVHIDLLNFYATDQGRKSQNILKDFCGV